MVSTREIFKLKASFYNLKPLKIAARLSMEDLSISMLNSEEKHILWNISERFSHIEEKTANEAQWNERNSVPCGLKHGIG